MKHRLIITPAVRVTTRHKIEDALKDDGYHVSGGGTHTDGSKSDISFEDEQPERK
jgi:hypothetical protein